MPTPLLLRKRPLLLLLTAVFSLGFLITTLVGYEVSKDTIRTAIQTEELPLTSDTIYSEILKDLVRPVFVSSMMASDTFLREWTVRGERDPAEITRYLREIMAKYGVFTSFFVSDRTHNYYHTSGIIKRVRADNPADAWYFRVRAMPHPYEVNVDEDMAHHNLLTIFINYRVPDFAGKFLGAAGVGLSLESVRRAIDYYQERFGRRIYFVNRSGGIVLYSEKMNLPAPDIHSVPGLDKIAPSILRGRAGSYAYTLHGETHLLNVRYIPELSWYLFVEKTEDQALAGIRRTLYVNLLVCLIATLLTISITGVAVDRYQRSMEDLAATDKLTGLLNRQTLDVLFRQAMGQARRNAEPFCVLIADIDRFKAINDRSGHLTGDMALKRVAARLRCGVRASDTVCRWGGEEFLMILSGCGLQAALALAEKLRAGITDDAEMARLVPGGLTLSLGAAEFRPEDDVDSLVARADEALYRAKQDGRNCVRAEQSPSSEA